MSASPKWQLPDADSTHDSVTATTTTTTVDIIPTIEASVGVGVGVGKRNLFGILPSVLIPLGTGIIPRFCSCLIPATTGATVTLTSLTYITSSTTAPGTTVTDTATQTLVETSFTTTTLISTPISNGVSRSRRGRTAGEVVLTNILDDCHGDGFRQYHGGRHPSRGPGQRPREQRRRGARSE